jgi:hypothetical protein
LKGTIPARFGLIWFRGFRGEDLNVIFYQNMPKDDFYTKGQTKIKNKTKQCKTKQKRITLSEQMMFTLHEHRCSLYVLMYSIARYVATTQIKQIASYCLSIDDLVGPPNSRTVR